MNHQLPILESDIRFLLVSDDFTIVPSLFDSISASFGNISFVSLEVTAFFEQMFIAPPPSHTLFIFDLSCLSDQQVDILIRSPYSPVAIYYDSSTTYRNAYRLILRNCTKLWHSESGVSRLADLISQIPCFNQSLGERIKHYCDEHLNQQISLGDLAEHFHLSSNYLSAIFKKKYNITIMQYILNRRMELAKYLLVSTSNKIYQIGQKCGYSNAKYFVCIFKSHVGVSPGIYRKVNSSTGNEEKAIV